MTLSYELFFVAPKSNMCGASSWTPRTIRLRCSRVSSLAKRRSCKMGRSYTRTLSKLATAFNDRSVIGTRALSCSHGTLGGTLWALFSMAISSNSGSTTSRLLIYGTMVTNGFHQNSPFLLRQILTICICYREDQEEFQLREWPFGPETSLW